MRNLKKNIGEIWKIFKDRNRKRGYLGEEDYQEGLQQENYLDSQIKDTTRNTGQGWKKIGGNRKEKEQGDKEQ